MAASAKVSTITLRLNDAFTGPLRAISAATSGFQRKMTAINASIAATSASMESAAMRLTAALTIPAALGANKALDTFEELDTANAALRKALGEDFTPDALKTIQSEAIRMGQDVAASTNAAAEAIKSGIASQDAVEFVNFARDVGRAFDMPIDQISGQMAKLQAALGLDMDGLRDFADYANRAADVSAASIEPILNFTARVSSMAKPLGISTSGLAAMAATFDSVGISAERGATATAAMFRVIGGAKLPKGATGALQELGYSLADIEAMAKNPEEALEGLLDRIAAAPAEKRLKLVTEIVGAESADETLALVEGNELRRKIKLEIETSGAGSVLQESKIAAATFRVQMEQLSNSFGAIFGMIGGRLAPAMERLGENVRKFAMYLDGAPGAVDKLVAGIGYIAAAGPALFIAAQGLKLVGAGLAVLQLATAPLARIGQLAGLLAASLGKSGRAAAGARKAFLALAGSTLKTTAMFTGLGLAAVVLYKSLPAIGKAFTALKSDIDLSAAASSASAAFSTFMQGRPEMAAHHASAAFASIGKAAKRLGANLKAALLPAWDSVMAAIDQRLPSFAGFRAAVSDVAGSIGGLFESLSGLDFGDSGNKIGELAKSLADGALKLGAAVLTTLAAALDALSNAIGRFNAVAPAGGLFAGLKAAFDGLPAVGKLITIGLGFRVFAGAAGTLAAAAGALRGLSFASLAKGIGKLGALKMGAIGYGLAELGKSYGILSKNVDSGTVAAAFMALPTAIQAAGLAASGAKALAGWAVAGAKAAAKYTGAFRVAQALGAAISAAWTGLTGAAAKAAGALAGAAYAGAVRVAQAIGSAIGAAWSALTGAAARAAGALGGAAYTAAVKVVGAVGAIVSAFWSGLTTGVARSAGIFMGGAYAAAVRTTAAIGSAISAIWTALSSAAARTAGFLAGAAYSGAVKIAAAIGSAISALWTALSTATAGAAGTLAAAAYNAAARLALAIGGAISAAWGAISTAAAGIAGAAAGRAFAAGAALSGFIGTALAGAFSGVAAAGSGAMLAAGTAGSALGLALGAAIALAIPAAVMAGLQLVDPNGNLGGLTKPLDDAIRRGLNLPEGDGGVTPGEILSGIWSKVTGNAPTIEQPVMPTPASAPAITQPAFPQAATPAAANDNAPVIEQPAFPVAPTQAQELGGLLNQIHDNAANIDIPSVSINAPQINVSSPPQAKISTPGQASPASGFGTVPNAGSGADLSSLKESISTLRGDTASELQSLRAAVEAGNATSAGQTGLLSSIDRGIQAIPGAVRINMPWQAGAGKAAGVSAPQANLPSTSYSSGPQ